MNTHTLTRHRDIQNWVADRHGMPAIRRVLNRFGEAESKLELTFSAPKAKPDRGMPRVDDGLMPVSWSAWLAELDRRHLALKVSEKEFEYVERKDIN